MEEFVEGSLRLVLNNVHFVILFHIVFNKTRRSILGSDCMALNVLVVKTKIA